MPLEKGEYEFKFGEKQLKDYQKNLKGGEYKKSFIYLLTRINYKEPLDLFNGGNTKVFTAEK